MKVRDEVAALDVREASTEADVRRCWPVFQELRPHIADEAAFVGRWRTQAAEGYRIAYVEEDGEVTAAAGYRFLHTMAWGRILYLDDLVALSARQGAGLGWRLLTWLQDEARRQACDAVHLDTGYQRTAAHRSYLRNGFTLSSHHLSWQVAES